MQKKDGKEEEGDGEGKEEEEEVEEKRQRRKEDGVEMSLLLTCSNLAQ